MNRAFGAMYFWIRALAGSHRSALALFCCASNLWSCNEPGVHLFIAFRYQLEADCVEPAAAVDVVDGNDPGLCEGPPRCWYSPGGETYVTKVACDAPPDYQEATDPLPGSSCAKALDALAADAICENVGGAGGSF